MRLKIGNEVPAVDGNYFDPSQVNFLKHNPTKVCTIMGWEGKRDLPAFIKDIMQPDLKMI